MHRIQIAMVMSLAIALPSQLSAQTAPLDTAVSNSGDLSFLTPSGWSTVHRTQVTTLVAPEGDLRFSIMDVGAAKSSDEAVLEAIGSFDPHFARKLRMSAESPAKSGWDEVRDYSYEVSPNEQLDVSAEAMRHGQHWTVVFATGSNASFNKRSGQINSFYESLRPVGYVPESFAGRRANSLDPARLGRLKAFIAQSMKELRIPGVGYAFIENDRIIDEGGLGVRELGKPQVVGAHTRFMIASNTKGMTTLLLAKLVDQGKLRWDEPVLEAYPEFQLGTPDVTRQIQIRHLVCACTGMPRQDFEWHFTGRLDTPPSRVFNMLRTMKPTSGFGEVYQYSNLLAASAGYVAAHVAYPDLEVGAGYDRAMKELIWKPLGMRDTTLDKGEAVRADYASPHSDDINDQVALADLRMNDNIYFLRPAGGAWSSAHDMALYALNELREGRLATGETFVSARNLLERRFRGVAYGEGITYGMGLENIENSGVRMIHHGGSLMGYKTDWFIVPAAGVGAVVLTNADNGRKLVNNFGRRLLEVLYDGKSEAREDVSSWTSANVAYGAKMRAELSIPPDPKLVTRLAGRYESAALGSIDIRRDRGGLVFDFGGYASHVATKTNQDGTNSFVMIEPGSVSLELVSKPQGKYDALVLRDSQHEYLYTPVEIK